ncbi:hypothetical protein [Clostridium sp. AWRP]|nr:hypothetical protein [Clostridium sp. AWRP]
MEKMGVIILCIIIVVFIVVFVKKVEGGRIEFNKFYEKQVTFYLQK